MRSFKPTWNQKKSIMYGSKENLDPARSAARRVSKVAAKLGDIKTSYYYWIVERLHKDRHTGSTNSTKFKCEEAAEALGVSVRTIWRLNKELEKAQLITVIHRMYMGRNSYATYICHDINEIINDQGVVKSERTDKSDSACTDKPDSAKRVLKSQDETISTPSTSSLPMGAKLAAAGHGAKPQTPPLPHASHPGKEPSTLDQKMIQFLKLHEGEILEVGFQPRAISSLLADLNGFFADEETWDTFAENWPIILTKLRCNQFLKKTTRLGFGWLFQDNSEGETNLNVVMFTRRYDDLELPPVVFRDGTKVEYCGHPWTIVSRREDSLTRYRICPERFFQTAEQDENTRSASISELKELGAVSR